MADEQAKTEKRSDVCANCKFFDDDLVALSRVDGTCRRFPPSSQHDSQSGVWATVAADDWCGEFASKG